MEGLAAALGARLPLGVAATGGPYPANVAVAAPGTAPLQPADAGQLRAALRALQRIEEREEEVRCVLHCVCCSHAKL